MIECNSITALSVNDHVEMKSFYNIFCNELTPIFSLSLLKTTESKMQNKASKLLQNKMNFVFFFFNYSFETASAHVNSMRIYFVHLIAR